MILRINITTRFLDFEPELTDFSEIDIPKLLQDHHTKTVRKLISFTLISSVDIRHLRIERHSCRPCSKHLTLIAIEELCAGEIPRFDTLRLKHIQITTRLERKLIVAAKFDY